ncbi:mechanosensitive ion channel family protein [Pseudomonas typographi]|uniref:Mechanosensitive ion channel family protein n=1 Tax=Pseudomonas typographi TaxID=2715964 RepID=A0ABR7Z1W1_9PSED|nr:mechanosensitive ion channel family protein [Pseudomonas typographi]MBD1551682.1 mechanosensitive ion channel family protein [Pseudomonas typographi]MBD1587063.1 mechanosensitive ion channel family protein [Pseudomonas typographi]MBD1599301.1 mechanosensitive ion channel family protein [Pseudomonas typographi]
MNDLIPEAWLDRIPLPWVSTLIAALMAVAIVLVARWAGLVVLRRIANSFTLAQQLIAHSTQPSLWLLPLLALQSVWTGAPDDLPMINSVRHSNGLLVVLAFIWWALRCVRAVAETVSLKNPLEVEDNLTARRIQTQVKVLVRCLNVVVILFGTGLMLMSFPAVKQIGTSLLASAGLAGLAAGFAAKPVLGNLIAGLQIAISQPIRLDDVVIVEGEWGRIEEITGSYVVVKIWDERRLVVPLTYFIEKPFQNWTRSSSMLIGSVFLWVDYSLPLEALREEVKAICEEIPHLWDGRVSVLQVTDTSEKSMQLRVLLSSADSSRNWDARCHMRERLITWINREFPECLPQLRAEMSTRVNRPDVHERVKPQDVERQPPV